MMKNPPRSILVLAALLFVGCGDSTEDAGDTASDTATSTPSDSAKDAGQIGDSASDAEPPGEVDALPDSQAPDTQAPGDGDAVIPTDTESDAEDTGDAADEGDGALDSQGDDVPGTEDATPSEDSEDSGGSDEDAGGADEDAADTSPDVQACLDICEAKAELGFCINPDGITAECEGFCQTGWPSWAQETKDAFTTCVLEDPLCYQMITSCTLIALHPNGMPSQLTVEGVNYDAWEGHMIWIHASQLGATALLQGALITDGGFEFNETFLANPGNGGQSGSLVLLYLDANSSGVCDAPDWTAAQHAAFQGDIENPAFLLELDGAIPEDADFVCDYF